MKKILKNCFNIVFIICFGYILYNSIFKNGVNLFLWDKTTVIIGILVNILLIIGFYEIISKIKKINTKIIVPVLLIIVFVSQCYIANLFKVSPNWDMKELFNNAELHINGNQSYLPYLYRYSNNIGIQIVIIALFKISDTIKIIKYYDIGILFNIIMIDIALIFTYLASKKMFNNKKALIIFIIMASMTPIYLYTPIVYTDTISMLFPPLILYLYLISKEKNKFKSKCILYSVISAITCIGIFIKFTVIIMPIAILIYEIIGFEKSELSAKEKSLIIFAMYVAIVIIVLIGMLTVKLVFTKWDKEEYKKNKFPYTHWIMMGINDVGNYSERDVKFTSSFQTLEEKKEKNIEVIKERVKKINLNSIRRKLMYTWGDGTYYAVNTLDYDAVNKGIHQQLVFKRGKYHKPYQYYTQIQHLTAIALMLIATVVSIKSKITKEFILRLSIFGLFLFLLIWEARSRYLVNYLPIMQMPAFIAIEELHKLLERVLARIVTIQTKI